MGPLGITLPAVATPRGNATSHARRKRFVADPCFHDDGQPISALTHATRGADELASALPPPYSVAATFGLNWNSDPTGSPSKMGDKNHV